MIDWTKPIRTKKTFWQDSIYDLTPVEDKLADVDERLVRIVGLHRTTPTGGVHESSRRFFKTATGRWSLATSNNEEVIEIENYEKEEDVADVLDGLFIDSDYIDLSSPYRIAENAENNAIYNLTVVDHGKHLVAIVQESHQGPDKQWYEPYKEWFFEHNGRWEEDPTSDFFLENYVPIDWDLPVRVAAFAPKGQAPIEDIRILSHDSSDKTVDVRINAPHFYTVDDDEEGGKNASYWFTIDGYALDAANPDDRENYIRLENYTPAAPPQQKQTQGPIDPTKPIRIKATEWQEAIEDVTVEKLFSQYISIHISVQHYVNKLDKESDYSSTPRSWSFDLPSGLFSGAVPHEDYISLENYEPEAPTKETSAMPTAEAEVAEKPRWYYPTAKKHDMAEDTLLYHLRRLVARNKVPSWHLTRIKKEGFGAKRFVVDRRKPVVIRDFKTHKTLKMIGTAVFGDEYSGLLKSTFAKTTQVTDTVAIGADDTKVFTTEGLYHGKEDDKQFGIFNEEILMIYELTMESESSLTELLSAVYGEE